MSTQQSYAKCVVVEFVQDVWKFYASKSFHLYIISAANLSAIADFLVYNLKWHEKICSRGEHLFRNTLLKTNNVAERTLSELTSDKNKLMLL